MQRQNTVLKQPINDWCSFRAPRARIAVRVAVLIGLVCSLAWTPAFAAEDYSQYRRLEAQAKLYTNLGRPARAAKAWLDAYERYPDEQALLHAVESYRTAKLSEKALRVAERYLRVGKVPAGRIAARKHMNDLRTSMSRHSAEYQIVTTPPDTWVCLQRPGDPKQDCMPSPIQRWIKAGDLIIHATTNAGVNRTHRLTVKSGRHLKVTIPVQLPISRGFLDVYSHGKGHEVLVDDIRRGVTPLTGLEVTAGRHVVSVAMTTEKSWLSEVTVRTGRTTTVYAGSAPPENPTNRNTVTTGSKTIKMLPPVIAVQRRLVVPVLIAGPQRVGDVGGPTVSKASAKVPPKKPRAEPKVAKASPPPKERAVPVPIPVPVPSKRSSSTSDVGVMPLPIPKDDPEPAGTPEESYDDSGPMRASDEAEAMDEPEEPNDMDALDDADAVPMPFEDPNDDVDEGMGPEPSGMGPPDDEGGAMSDSDLAVSAGTSVAWETVTGWSSIGVGIALVGGAVATSVLAMNSAKEANGLTPGAPGYDSDFSKYRDQAETHAMLTNIMLPTGAALIAAGVTLVLLAPDTTPVPAVALDEKHRMEFQAIPLPGGVLVNTSIEF